MKLKHYVPLLVLLILVAVATIQGVRRQTNEPKLLQSQVAAAENSLEDLARFSLEIELLNGEELELHYPSRGQQSSARTDNAEEVRTLVEALPSLAESGPLTLIQATLEHLGLAENDVEEFSLAYRLTNDQRTRFIELEVDFEEHP